MCIRDRPVNGADDTAEPVVTPSLAPSPGGATMGRVTRNVYTRAGPGLDYPIDGGLIGDEVVPVLGRDAGGDWFLVQSANGPVWISKGYITAVSGSLTGVEMAATIPVLPTAAAGDVMCIVPANGTFRYSNEKAAETEVCHWADDMLQGEVYILEGRQIIATQPDCGAYEAQQVQSVADPEIVGWVLASQLVACPEER